MQLSEKDISVVNALVTHFYDVVPREYNTYCSLTARIAQSALKHFGIDAKLLPCQVWLVTDEQNFVVGFLGNTSEPHKWDGHVVCRAGNLIIDAALKHFENEFVLNVPSIVSAHCFNVPTQVISRLDLNAAVRLWWHYPPATPGIKLTVPDEPHKLIQQHSTLLIERIATIAAVDDLARRNRTTGTMLDTSNS